MSTTPEGSAPAVVEDPIETPADQPAAPALAGAAAVASGYTSEIREVDANLAARMATSWRDGCPVPLADLRYVVVSYRGFDGADHTGELVVAASVAGTVTEVFRDLYDSGYPIASMRLVDDFGGSDDASMAANNTSAFNCRPVTGGGGFSEHSYGTAIDLNPVQNPYLSGSLGSPRAGPRLSVPAAGARRHPGRRCRRQRVRQPRLDLGWHLERADRLPALLGVRPLTGSGQRRPRRRLLA